MFRASYVASEEILPVLEHAAITTVVVPENATTEETRLKRTKEHILTYGLNVVLPPPKHKYPVAVVFVLITKFFEAFAANGIRTILALYLRDSLLFSESFSTIMLHIFNFFGQFCPIFGAILADSYMGNIRTISSFCFLYALGWFLLILTSFPLIGLPIISLVSMSLLFIAIGNGSIRACITSLGALQFKIPEQSRQLAEYFSLYYFVYYSGIFLSKLLPPLVRAKTQCFNRSGCYPAVFGCLGSAFLTSWLIFVAGKWFYKPEKLADKNVLVQFYGCIKCALLAKCRIGTTAPKAPKYWLHYAIGPYESSFVNDVAKVLKISKLFIPLPVYFALLAQQDSSWTFQASAMNTTMFGVIIQPDQAKAMGPIFLFIMIPTWQYLCVPLLRRHCHFEVNPLKSVLIGGFCSAVAFICAGILQEHIYNQPYKHVSIAWQIPQFVLLMLGELLLSIPGLQFAFTEAPDSMKSVVTAAWFLNNAFGNLLVVLITKLSLFNSQSTEYLFYGVLMLVSVVIFALLAYDYVVQERVCCSHPSTDRTQFASSPGNRANDKDNVPSTSSSVAKRPHDRPEQV